MTINLFDAAYPAPASDPQVQGALVYIGGDTPHVWTDAEDKAAYGRYRLPVYVRSNPASANSKTDANAAVSWLKAHKVPAGRAVVLDLETAVDATYVTGFAGIVHAAGFKVLPYGSKSTIFKNPKCDGYFVADPTGVDHVLSGSSVTQWKFAGAYDEDDVTDIVGMLWDYNPPKATVASTTPKAATVTTKLPVYGQPGIKLGADVTITLAENDNTKFVLHRGGSGFYTDVIPTVTNTFTGNGDWRVHRVNANVIAITEGGWEINV